MTSCNSKKPANVGGAQAKPAPLSVEVYTVHLKPITNMISLSGRARAYREAEIRPEVSGIIVDRLFDEGQAVTKGTALYKIDSARYKAEVESAKAGLARAEAVSKLADDTLARYERLSGIGAVSQQEYDNAIAEANQARADISIQRAQLDRKTIDYDKTTIRAPISGQIGRSSVTIGALVTANQTQALAKVLRLDPINIDMAVPSLRVVEFKRQIRDGEIKVDDRNAANVDVILENGKVYGHKGMVAFGEVSVDEQAGSVTLRATVPNPEGTLLPGMYLEANLSGSSFDSAALVPQEAVTRTARGETVIFLANEQGESERRVIRTVGNFGNNWIVTEGLKTGDKIITTNLQNMRDGMAVNPHAAAKG